MSQGKEKEKDVTNGEVESANAENADEPSNGDVAPRLRCSAALPPMVNYGRSIIRRIVKKIEKQLRAEQNKVQIEKVTRATENDPRSSFLGMDEGVAKMRAQALVQTEVLMEVKKKFMLTKGQFVLCLPNLNKIFDQAQSLLLDEEVAIACPFDHNSITCDPNAIYRSADGSCNNLQRHRWGQAKTPFRRLLAPDYGDGVGSPREASSGRPLPSARLISNTIHQARGQSHPHRFHTSLLMTFGQILDHDLARTAITKLEDEDGNQMDVPCGLDNCDTTHAACFPIPIPRGDPTHDPSRCIKFVRTAGVSAMGASGCVAGVREQLNQISAFLDAGIVYGDSADEMNALRSFEPDHLGELKMSEHPFHCNNKPLLPYKDVADCERCTTDSIKCFSAGDRRVNEHVPMTVYHTLLAREHNRIAVELKKLNPWWDQDRVFHVARRILIASWQTTIYREYLPVILGEGLMEAYELELEKDGQYYTKYDPDLNPQIANVFNTVAFRFGHSQVSQHTSRCRSQTCTELDHIELPETLFCPLEVYNVMHGCPDSIALAAVKTNSETVDHIFEESIRSFMFSKNPGRKEPGGDLVAINIQRGRDHGIPGYNSWREFAGLEKFVNMNNIPAVDIPLDDLRRKLKELYDSPDDIDLFTGGLLEPRGLGAAVGATFGHVIAEQFRRARRADRFWFETDDSRLGFTMEQLNSIRNGASIARLYCDNCDRVGVLQPFILLKPFDGVNHSTNGPYDEYYTLTQRFGSNTPVKCSELSQIDLSLWTEPVPNPGQENTNGDGGTNNRGRTRGRN